MKRLTIFFLTTAILWFAIDRIGGMGMFWINQHTHDMTSPKLKKIVQGTDAQVIMIGTSRCNGHYVPSIIGDTLGLTVYNAGIDGSDNIFAQHMALCHLLVHSKPQMVCLEVQNSFIEVEEDAFATTSFFAPYFGLNRLADSVFFEAGTYRLYQFSFLYRFNAKALPNITGLLKNRWGNEDNGYIPKTQPAFFPDKLEKEDNLQELDSKKLEYVKRFIILCQQNGIKLVFMVSPKYSIVDAHHYDVLKDIAKQNGIPFLDYHTSGLYLDHPEYFKDGSHLWDKGTRLYSSVFASDLKRVLKSCREENRDS